MKHRDASILLPLAALQCISLVDFMILMPLGPLLLQSFAIDAREFSWVVAAYTSAAGLAGFLAAPWLDRVPRRAAYLGLSLGLLGGIAASGCATSYPLLLAGRALTGLFAGVHGALALAIVADVIPPERRGRAKGMLMMSMAFASAVGVPIAIALGNQFGWAAPFFALSLLGLPLLAWAAGRLPAVMTAPGGARPPLLENLRQLLATPAHLRAFALVALLMAGAFAVIPFISTYLVGNVGVRQSQLPAVFLVGGAATFLLAPLTGRLADRHGARPVLCGTVMLAAAMMVLLTHLPAVGLPLAAGVAGLMMASNASRMVAVQVLVAAAVEPRHRGGFLAVNSSVQQLASALGTAGGGLLLAGGPGEPLRHFGTVGLLAAGVTLASLGLIARLPPVAPVGATPPQ